MVLLLLDLKTLAECIAWNSSYYFSGAGQATFPPDNKPPTKSLLYAFL